MIGDRNEQFWGDHAAIYDTEIDRVIGRDSREAVFSFLQGFRGLGSVVEFGCGPGNFTRAIAQNATHVLATDIAAPMLDRARHNLKDVKNVSFQKVNVEHTPFPDHAFDTVFTANVVQVLEHPDRATAEAYRIMKPGGRLILLFYNFDHMGMFDKFVTYVRFMSRFHGMPFRHMMTLEEARAMAEKAGFRVEESKIIGGKVKAVYLLGRKPT